MECVACGNGLVGCGSLALRELRKVSVDRYGRNGEVPVHSARGGIIMPLCRIFTVALLLAAFGAASYGQPATKTVMVKQPTPAIDVGPNPKNFQLMVMFTSPINNPTRIFTRFANTKNMEFRIEKMTGPFDVAEFKTVVQPVGGERQHSLTIDDAGGKGIMQGDKISFTLLAAAPMGSMFETRDTDPNTPSKDFRIQSGTNSVDIELSNITFTATQVPEPSALVTLSVGLCLLAARRRHRRGSAGKRMERIVRRSTPPGSGSMNSVRRVNGA